MGPDENIKKKKKTNRNPFYRFEQKKSWRHICACTPFLKDKEMRERILAMIALFPEDDPFAADIHYHKKCWVKHITNTSTKKRRDHVKCITKREVDAVFIDHVQRTICRLNEPRTLKSLINDYQNFLLKKKIQDILYQKSY